MKPSSSPNRRSIVAASARAPWLGCVLALATTIGGGAVARAQEGESPPTTNEGEASPAAPPATVDGADAAEKAGQPSPERPTSAREAPPPRPAGPPPDVTKELKKPIYKKMSLSIGSPHAGRQVRAKKLRGDVFLHVLKKGSTAVFGHPSLVLMLHRSAKQVAKKFPGSKLLVGDLSSEDGGALVGHHSHQSGRDADVLFYARDAKGKLVVPKKFVQYDANGKATDGSGLVFDDERNWLLVESWSKDKRAGLKYVFVARWLRTRLLSYALKHPKYKDEVQEASALFLQPEGAEPHDDHFHVRIKCPAGQEKICVE